MENPEDAIYLHKWSPPLVRIPNPKVEALRNKTRGAMWLG
jgi:hypothetical protein